MTNEHDTYERQVERALWHEQYRKSRSLSYGAPVPAHAYPGKCPICGRAAASPRMVLRDGEIYECCVGDVHDGHAYAPNTAHAAFVARARAAGITGKS